MNPDAKDILTLAIRNDFYKEHLWLIFTGEIYPAELKKWREEGASETNIQWNKAMWIQQLSPDKYKNLFFVLRDQNNKPIGFINASHRKDLDNGKCFLEYMLIDEKYRGNGASADLLNLFFTWCEKVGRTKIKVQFKTEDKRLNYIYSKYGFKKMNLEEGDNDDDEWQNWYRGY